MIPWKRENVFKILCLFGDAREHPWMEVVNLGTRLFLSVPISRKHKTHQAKFEEFLSKAITYGLVDMIETPTLKRERLKGTYQISKHNYLYKISAKGDKILRQEQAERTGDSFFYNLYDRGVDTPFGVDKFAPLPKGFKKS